MVATLPVLAVAMASASVARADGEVSYEKATTPPGPGANRGGDTVHLKNGGILRGTLVDSVPGKAVRILLVTSEIATVAWDDVARLDLAGSARPQGASDQGPAPAPAPSSAPAPGSAPAPLPAPPPVRERPRGVEVHIDAPGLVELQRDTTGDGDWITVCSSPCGERVSAEYSYRVTGPKIRASRAFVLRAVDGESETLEVRGSSRVHYTVGLIGLIGGGTATLIGMATAGDTHNTTDTHAAAGIVALVGAAVAATGTILMLENARSDVDQREASRADARRSEPDPAGELSGADRTTRALFPAAAQTSVLTLRF
jgi:hypothetical protein